jgi:hypothetical protein
MWRRRKGLCSLVGVIVCLLKVRRDRIGIPRLPGRICPGQVVTRGTPPRKEGCRPASRGYALALVT